MKKVMKSILNGFEKVLELIIALVAMVLFILAFIPLRLIFPTKIIGRKNLRKVKGGKIVASNHFSNLDIVLLIAYFYPITFARKILAKIELGKIWISKVVFKGVGAIFIDRSRVDIKAMKETVKYLQKGKTIIMFPEGTRNKEGEEDTKDLKSGVIYFAQKADATIVPLIILHRPKAFRRNTIIIQEGYKIDKTQKCNTEEEVKRLTEVFSNTREKYSVKVEE